ncbi:MAG: DNA alkylation repair protein [Prevotellaceae bacterium]|jgi:3-methyladenine DNA glycosylase AlkD|nr:DNA alkylation repair protein [Prevotellaceae bacterium]
MEIKMLIDEFRAIENAEKAEFLRRFFKTGKGEYAEGDLFLGLTVPQVRLLVKPWRELPLSEIQTLIYSEYHEIRLAGFILLVHQFKKAKTATARTEIYRFYIQHARQANNWDLVDLSCRDIVGGYLLPETNRQILLKLANSNNLWEQRIAIVSTWLLIKNGEFDNTFAIAKKFMTHSHSLIHKATGWMLREVGKQDRAALVEFLDKYCASMPRTCLRYAIEHFSPDERRKYMTNETNMRVDAPTVD